MDDYILFDQREVYQLNSEQIAVNLLIRIARDRFAWTITFTSVESKITPV